MWDPGSTRVSSAFLDANWCRIGAMSLIHLPAGHHVVTDDSPHPIATVASRRTLKSIRIVESDDLLMNYT